MHKYQLVEEKAAYLLQMINIELLASEPYCLLCVPSKFILSIICESCYFPQISTILVSFAAELAKCCCCTCSRQLVVWMLKWLLFSSLIYFVNKMMFWNTKYIDHRSMYIELTGTKWWNAKVAIQFFFSCLYLILGKWCLLMSNCTFHNSNYCF